MEWFSEYHQPSLIIVSGPSLSLLKQITEENLANFLFRARPSDLPNFAKQHAQMCATLQHHGVQVIDILDLPLPETAKALIHQSPNMFFTRDSAICLSKGGIILRMATEERALEPLVMEYVYRTLHIPILARVPDGQFVEGGDIIFAGKDLLFVGYGPRTTISGVEFIRDLLICDSVEARELVAIHVSSERINLDGVLMPLSSSLIMADLSALDRTAIIYSKREKNRVDFRNYLEQRGFNLLNISRFEGFMLATNLVHLGGKQLVAYDHNKETNNQLERMGFTVFRIPGNELVKGSGGPRCMTNIIRYPNVRHPILTTTHNCQGG